MTTGFGGKSGFAGVLGSPQSSLGNIVLAFVDGAEAPLEATFPVAAPAPQSLPVADHPAFFQVPPGSGDQNGFYPAFQDLYFGRAFRTVDQQAFARVADRAISAASAVAPDSLQPPRIAQDFFGRNVAPERTAPPASTSSPDSLPLPRVALDFSSRNVAPERTSAIASASHPDRLPPAAQALGHSVQGPFPERASPLASTSFPDIPGKAFAVPWRQYASVGPEVPERTSVPSFVDFPDALPLSRIALDFSSRSGQPERTSPLAIASFPDAVPGATAGPGRPFASAQNLVPITATFSPIGAAFFPDSAPRPAYEARQQPFVTGVAPSPELKVPNDWATSWADRAPAPPRVAESQFAINVRPERTQVLASESHPDRFPAPRIAEAQQAISTKVERTQVLADRSSPDRIWAAEPRTWLQPYSPTTIVLPVVPAQFPVAFPDSVPLPRLGAWHHLAAPSTPPQIAPPPLPGAPFCPSVSDFAETVLAAFDSAILALGISTSAALVLSFADSATTEASSDSAELVLSASDSAISIVSASDSPVLVLALSDAC